VKEPSYIQALCNKISKLPQDELLKCKSLTPAQSWQSQNIKNDWEWFALRLTYLLLKRLGRRMPDPLNRPDIEDANKQRIDVISRLFLAEFDLIIEGWEIIESTALKEKGYFPFNHPTELFGDVCRYRSASDIEDLFTEKTICEVTLKQIRQNLREDSNFLRDRLNQEKQRRKLAAYKDSEDWALLTIYAIWNFRHNHQLVDHWKHFLKAHKNYVAMLCNKNFFTDKDVNISAYIYTGDGRILLRHGRELREGKFVNDSLVFP
jgi:hypothetical protein